MSTAAAIALFASRRARCLKVVAFVVAFLSVIPVGDLLLQFGVSQ